MQVPVDLLSTLLLVLFVFQREKTLLLMLLLVLGRGCGVDIWSSCLSSLTRLPPPLPQPRHHRDLSSPPQCPPPLRVVLCLWEGGEPYMLDLRTLETISPFDILCHLGSAGATDEAVQDDDCSEVAHLGPGGHGCMRQGSTWARACWDRSSVVSLACWPSCCSRTTRSTKRGTGL